MTAAFNHPPIDPSFNTGERTIGVSNPVNGASAVTYRIARFLDLPHGVYNIRWLSFGNSVLRVGRTAGTLATTFEALSGQVVQTQIYIEGGELRFDIELQGRANGLTTGVIFVIFALDRVIYASNADGWEFDTTALSDAALTRAEDPRRSLPVWSILPNWRDGVTEFVEYLTDSITSETGNTVTRALREVPRRQFEFEFMRHGMSRARMDNMILGVGSGRLLLPLWHEQYKPANGILMGQIEVLFPEGDLSLREYRDNDLVIVTLGDPADYEVLTVESVLSDRLVLSEGPQRDWPSGSRIAPMRIATIGDSNSISNITDRAATGRVRFAIEEREDGFGEYFGFVGPVWRFKINWSSAVDVDHERLSYTFDNQTSLPYTVDPGQRAIVLTRARSLIRGRSEMVRLRRFIQAARGRARRFWMPSFTLDIEPLSGIGGTTFAVKKNGLLDYARTIQSARMFIAVAFADGSPQVYREIVSYGELQGSDIVEVDFDLPIASLAEIERIQFIVPTRFDQDRFEFKHLVDESAAVQVGFTFRSADHDGLELPFMGFTSVPYPITPGDRMDVSGSFVGATYGGVPPITESLDVLGSFVAATYPLTVLYENVEVPSESLDVSGSFVVATHPLTIRYSTLELASESLDVSGSFVVATYPITVNYINYVLESESMNVSASFVGASFS